MVHHMKLGIYGGEAFPVYEVHKEGFDEIEIDEETANRWRQAFAQFSQAQEEIIQELEKQGIGSWPNGAWYGFHVE
jgi:ribosomal protein S16